MANKYDKISATLGELKESAKQQNESIKLLVAEHKATHNIAYATKIETEHMAREVNCEHKKIFERIQVIEDNQANIKKRQQKNSTFVDIAFWFVLALLGIIGSWLTGIGNKVIGMFL